MALLPARLAILLTLSRPASGSEIVTRLAHLGIGLGFGSVYPALRSLEAEGLVRSWPERRPRGRPRRNYELTQDGVRSAAEERQAVLGLLQPGVPPRARVAEQGDMAERIRQCDEVSQLALSLAETDVR